MRSHWALLPLLWTSLLTSSASGQAPATPDPLAECGRKLAAEGESRDTANCFKDAEALPEQIEAALGEAIALQGDTQKGWLTYVLGLVAGGEKGRDLYQQALQIFERRGDSAGIFHARLGLSYKSVDGGDLLQAERHLIEARRAHGASWTADEEAKFLYYETRLRYMQGELNEAYFLIRRADRLVTDPKLQSAINNVVNRVSGELDLPDQAYAAAREQLEIASGLYRETPTLRNLSSLAHAYYDLGAARTKAFLPTPVQRKLYREDLRRALEAARQSENRDVEIRALRYLAELEEAPQAQDNLQRCLQLAVGDFSYLRAGCLRTRAALLAGEDPPSAQQFLLQAHRADDELSDLWNELKGWQEHCEVLWQVHTPQKAIALCLPILDAVESLRRHQWGDIRDRLLSKWAETYYWMSGKLLLEENSRPLVERAFSIMERLRAQSLREALSQAQGQGPKRPPADDPELQGLTKQLESCFRRLLDPSLNEQQQSALLLELEQTENALQRRRRALGQHENLPALPVPDPDLLSQVQAALGEDEALLSYQVGLWEGYNGRFQGGSFLLAVTSDAARVHRLQSDRSSLDSAVSIFLSAGDVPSPEDLSALYERLLRPAITELPPGVDKLILVLDGVLHRVPFSRLAATPDSPRLIEKYRISTAPSAALWLQLREAGSRDAPVRPPTDAPQRRALIVAAPSPPSSDDTSQRGGWREWDVRDGRGLGVLPYAQEEGRRIQRRLGGLLWTADRASEDALKGLDLTPYPILHFATHALVRDLHPNRSAVLLTPTPSEDGWLRTEEIAQLRGLKGKLVVLASCNGSAGEILRGEGVLSLARSFFAAGARSVIGSLKPLDDRQAMLFFDDFYSHLAKGKSVGEALADTQRQWLSRRPQDPTWSSIVLLGESSWTPFPGGLPGGTAWSNSTIAAALAAAVLCGLFLFWRRGRPRAAGS